MTRKSELCSFVLVGIITLQGLRAQPHPAASLSFDVASIKPALKNLTAGERLRFLPGGRFVAENTPLCMLITAAYNLQPQSPRISGGPNWIWFERFDVEAKTDQAAAPPGEGRKLRDSELRLMLQSLLAERFKLKLVRETKEMPVYVLVVQRGGPKLQSSKINAEEDCVEDGAAALLVTASPAARVEAFMAKQSKYRTSRDSLRIGPIVRYWIRLGSRDYSA